MIHGIGVDIIEIARFQRLLDHDPRFVERIFSSEEISYCHNRFKPAQHYAARFTAKEAFLKALGTGFRGGVGWKEIFVIHDALGKPSIELIGRTLEKFNSLRLQHIHLSLTHSHEYAAAFVILE